MNDTFVVQHWSRNIRRSCWQTLHAERDMRAVVFMVVFLGAAAIAAPVPAQPATAPLIGGCGSHDSVAAVSAVRARLTEWVQQNNRGEVLAAGEVWGARVVGWFPPAAVFSDSAAARAAGVSLSTPAASARTTYELVIDDIVANGTIVVVHDIWTETRTYVAGQSARRIIRGSELWRCQPDGRWRILRFVSAPEPWTSLPARN